MIAIQMESQVTEVSNKFKRLIHHLGNNNSSGFVVSEGKVSRLNDNEGNPIGPSERYKFEVEFAYILVEISRAPEYIVQKHIDRANFLVMELIAAIKDKGVEATVTTETV